MIPNPWILLGLGIAWLASLVAVGAWQRDDGATHERDAWQARELRQVIAAADKHREIAARYRAAERAHAVALAAASADYQRRLSHVDSIRRADAAALRAGTLVLRDPDAPGLRAGRGCLPAASPAPGGSDGAEAGRLSPAAAGFLLGLAADADQVAEQLAGCQAAIAER
jgi:hypothetical protein